MEDPKGPSDLRVLRWPWLLRLGHGLLLLLLVSDGLTSVPAEVRALATVLAFTAWPLGAAGIGTARVWAALLGLLLGMLAVRLPAPAAAGTAVFFWLVLASRRARAGAPADLERFLALVAASHAVLWFAVQTIPLLGNVVRTGTLLATRELSLLGARVSASSVYPVALGPSAAGGPVLLLFAALGAVAVACGCRRWRGFVVLGIGLWLLYFASVPWVVDAAHRYAGKHWFDHLEFDALLFLLGLVPSAYLLRRAPTVPAIRLPRWSLPLALPALPLVLPLVPERRACRVVFLDKGTLEWSKPYHERFGARSAGMFGLTPDYLESLGHEVVRGGVEELDRADLLLIANLLDPLEERELARIHSFVEAGGGLILLADHTGGERIQDPSNQVLWPAGVQVNFDTAVPKHRGWSSCIDYALHPTTRAIETHREVWTWLGASLFLRGTAEPLLVGRRAFSDAGTTVVVDPKRGLLGDLEYRRGELLGDVVLTASSTLGRGSVVVMGDTSALQGLALANSYDYADRLVRWTTWRSPWRRLWEHRVSLAVLLLGCAAWGSRRCSWRSNLCVLGLSPLWVLTHGPVDRWLETPPPVASNVGWIDATHRNRADSTGWESRSIGHVELSLLRAGRLPLVLRDLADLRSSPVGPLVVHAPTRPFRASEVDALESYAQRGATVILAAGFESEAAVAPVLERFDLRLLPVPLGPAPVVGEFGSATFCRANPVVARSSDAPEALATSSGYAVVVRRRVGEGAFIHIADSCLLYNRNFEDLEGLVSGENVAFLHKLLAAASSEE